MLPEEPTTVLLDDKVAVVYGAGAIGGAVARAFAHEGAEVVVASRTLALAEAVVADIAAAGGRAEAASVEASDEAAVEAHVAAVEARAGVIDILFNAIDVDDIQGTPLLEMELADVVGPVVKAVTTQFITARAVARRMAERGAGVILSVSIAPAPVALHGSFGVACATIEGLWRSLAIELGPHGIRTVILRSAGSPDAPGVREVLVQHAEAQGLTLDEFLARVSRGNALRRWPLLDEVANAAVLMASDRASATTGAMINVTTGGWFDL